MLARHPHRSRSSTPSFAVPHSSVDIARGRVSAKTTERFCKTAGQWEILQSAYARGEAPAENDLRPTGSGVTRGEGFVMERYFTDQRHEELRAAVREFAKHEVTPRIAEMEASRTASLGLSRLIARQGWIGATVPAARRGGQKCLIVSSGRNGEE